MSQETITIALNSQAQTGGIMAVVNGLKQVKETATAGGTALSGLLAKIVGAVGAGLGIGSLVHMTDAALEGADALGKAAQKAGTTVEALSALAYSAKLSDVSIEQLTIGAKGLAQWMAKTGQSGRDMTEVMLEQADVFANMEDGSTKVALATERFGKAGIQLIPLLNQGSAAIRQQAEEARKLGLVIGPGFAKVSEEFNDNVTKIKGFFLGVFNSLAAAIAPSLARVSGELVDWMLEVSPSIRKAVGDSVAAIQHGYNDSLAPSIISGLGSAIKSVGQAFGVMSKGAVDNLGLIQIAINGLIVALGILSVQATVAGASMVARLFAPTLAFFAAANTSVAVFSRNVGMILGVGAAFTTWTGALSVIGSLLAGISLGKLIGEVDLLGTGTKKFGATINDTVTFNILKAMEAWEKFKLMMGLGSMEQVAAASGAVQEFLSPAPKRTKAPEPEKEATKPHVSPAAAMPLDQYRIAVEDISNRIEIINKETSISDEERNKELRELYSERIDLVKKLQDEIGKNTTRFVADPAGGPDLNTQQYLDVSKELNSLLKEQADTKEKIRAIDRSNYELRQKSLDTDIAKAELENQQLSDRGVKSGGHVAGSLQEEGAAIDANLKRMRQLAIEKAKVTAQEKDSGLLNARDAQAAEIQNAEKLLDINRQIAALKEQRNDYSFIEKLTRNLQDLGDEFRHVGAAIADTLTNGIKGAIDVVSRGLWQVIDGTATWGQLFLQVGRQIISSLIQIAIQELIVDNLKRGLTLAWVAFKSAMGWGEQADHAAQKTTEVAVHTTAETTKTGATFFGAIGRGVIRLGETIYHGILTGIKVVAHLAGEAAMTAGTIFNAAIRMPITLLEAGKDLIGAAFKAAKAVADIPFVGPILAIAAMATIIGAGVKYMGGFEKGGVLSGGPQLIQVNENGEESILNARATAMLGEERINAMNAGYFDLESRMASRVVEVPTSGPMMAPSMSQQSGSQQSGAVNIILVDSRNSQAARDFMESSSGRALIVEVVRDQKVEVGIG